MAGTRNRMLTSILREICTTKVGGPKSGKHTPVSELHYWGVETNE